MTEQEKLLCRYVRIHLLVMVNALTDPIEAILQVLKLCVHNNRKFAALSDG